MTLLVATAWLAYRVSEGPVELDFLTPYIEDALSKGDISVKLDTTILTTGQSAHSFEIRARMVQARVGDKVVIAIPDMAFSLSLPAMLRGMIAPHTVKLYHPTFRLTRETDGEFRLGPEVSPEAQEPSVSLAKSTLDALMSEDDSLAGQIHGIDIVGATLSIDDRVQGRQWHATPLDIRMRRDDQALSLQFSGTIDQSGEPLHLNGSVRLSRANGAISGKLDFTGLRPPEIALLAPPLAPLSSLNLLLSGSVSGDGTLAAGPTSARFDIKAGPGEIDDTRNLGGKWPVRSLSAAGTLKGFVDSVSLDSFRLDLNGPVISLSGHAENLLNAPSFDISVLLEDMPVDELKIFWPPALAPDPRRWVVTNLSKGNVKKATVHAAGKIPQGGSIDDAVIDDISGQVFPVGVSVQYLSPMPIVKNVSADCRFDRDAFKIAIRSGELYGLAIPEGRVDLTGLSQAEQFADIDLTIKGPLSDALRVIDSKPLRYPSALGLQPSRISGDSSISLSLRFPLIARLNLDGIALKAKAQTGHVAIPDVVLGLDLSDATLAIDVDTKALDLSGKGLLGGNAADVKWHENFTKDASFRSRYMAQLVLDDNARKDLGLGSDLFQTPYLKGPVAVDVLATLFEGGRGDILIKSDLKGATMAPPGLNWIKPAGEPAQAEAELKIVRNRLSGIKPFSISSPVGNLEIEGQVALDGGKLRQITLAKAKWNRSDLKGTLTVPKGEPMTLDLSGVLDARELVSGKPSDLPEGMSPPERHVHDHSPVEPLKVTARLPRVWLSDQGAIDNVTVAMSRDTRDWQRVKIDGTFPDDKTLHVEINPAGVNRRALKVTSNDAGDVFRALDIFDNIKGGRLSIDAAFDDSDPRQPLKGVAKVDDFRLKKAPALARLLTVAALTGIVDVLSGEGIHFSSLEAPFTLTDGVLDLSDARASGTELGLTAKGQFDLDHDRVALEGTVVPAYLLNSALGNIPIIGSVFSAEKGGGVFAVNYSMKGPSTDPTVTVNPLSALTPGFLRRVFRIFDDSSDTQVRPENEENTKPQKDE